QDRITLEDALDSIEEKWIRTIDDYHFPVVTLSDKTEPDALCTIFETLNRTGVKLSVFELLTARFWPQNLKLRELWDKRRLVLNRANKSGMQIPTHSWEKTTRSAMNQAPIEEGIALMKRQRFDEALPLFHRALDRT